MNVHASVADEDSAFDGGGMADRAAPTTVDGFPLDTVVPPPAAAPALAPSVLRPLRTETLLTGRLYGKLPASRAAGARQSLSPVEAANELASPMAVLEEAVLTALLRPPCLVTFSGGMDSTFVLAVALQVARRHGLPLPIPVSWRFPQAPKADESVVQDELLGELGAGERLVWSVTEELDLVGPVASRLLARHGPVFPANLHLHLPMMELARGGSVLTGWGGDQVLGAWARPRWPRPRAVLRSGWSALPSTVRALVPRSDRATAADFPWLVPAAAGRIARLARGAEVNGWGRPDRRLTGYRRSPGEDTCSHNLVALGAAQDVLTVNPLYEPAFLSALTATLPRAEVLSRGEVMAAISDGQLPQTVFRERRKAWFGDVLRGSCSASFVSSWDGDGIDCPDVDVEALQRVWAAGQVPQGTEYLLQQAWTHRLRTDAVVRRAQ